MKDMEFSIDFTNFKKELDALLTTTYEKNLKEKNEKDNFQFLLEQFIKMQRYYWGEVEEI